MNREERLASMASLPFETIGGSKSDAVGIKGFVRATRDIYANRNMLALLVRRDLKSRYKDSALGFTWTLVRPITQLLIYYVVLGKFLGAERGIPAFAIYIFTGLTAYGLFQEIVSGGTNSILANSGLVKKVYVPRELFPLASTGTAIFNFVIQLGILLVASAVLGNLHISWDVFYAIPATLILLTYGLACAILFSAWNVYLRDVGYLVEVVMMVLMWTSPVLYSWQMVRDVISSSGAPWLLELYTNNPITLAILGFQNAFWGTSYHGLALPENLELRMVVALLVGLVAVFIAQRIFSRLQGNFAQEL